MASLSRRLVQAVRLVEDAEVPAAVADKVKIGLLDMLSCAFEAQDLPWGCQAIEMASRTGGGPASIVGTPFRASTGDAAFVNATLGHGLVREDMHPGAVSHLGVVIHPVLLALSQRRPVTGRTFLIAAACGYEIGASLGRALVDKEFVQFHRPTGTTGPIGGAVAGSLLYGLGDDAMVSAIGLAANTTGGLNEWPYAGGDEMFFHPGFAARNAVTAVELAELGAFASETALDGQAGLFATLGRGGQVAAVAPFRNGVWEILSVYYKPAPACNYAQTACQTALVLAVRDGVRSSDIEHIAIRCSAAAVAYPGCNYAGPFERVLQAKMSIQYCVAATLAKGAIEEENYRLLNDAEINRLAAITELHAGDDFTANYPGKQGAEIALTLRTGETRTHSLDDVVAASPGEIRERFRAASAKILGSAAAHEIETFVDELEDHDDVGVLGSLLERHS